MSDLLTFNEEIHEYRYEGRKVPSVTGILSSLDFIEDEFFTLESQERGIKVHRITELYDLGSLDEDTVDPRLAGYLKAWITFQEATGLVFTMIEHRVYHPGFAYAGTLDRKGVDKKGHTILLDIKTGVKAVWHQYQLGGYALCCQPADELMTVHLMEDGQFRVEEHNKNEAISGWRAIIQTYNLRENR